MTRRRLAIVILFGALGIGAGAFLAVARRAHAQGYGDALVNAQEQARRLKCQSNLKQIYLVIEEYRNQEGHRPSSLQVLVDKKLISQKLLKCPSGNTSADTIDYRYVSSAGGNDPLCVCSHRWHQNGRNVLKANGTVEWQKK